MKPARNAPYQGSKVVVLTPFNRIVGAIGVPRTIDLLLKFGGGTVYIPSRPQSRSRLVEVIGVEAVTALHRELGRGHLKLPLGNAWIAAHLDATGVSIAEIGRVLRVSRQSVRGYLGLAEQKMAA